MMLHCETQRCYLCVYTAKTHCVCILQRYIVGASCKDTLCAPRHLPCPLIERPTARVSVRLQSNKMVLEVRQSDILPATDADISKASRAKAKQKNVVKEIRAAAAAQRAGGASASYAAVLGVVFLGANLLVLCAVYTGAVSTCAGFVCLDAVFAYCCTVC